MKPEKYKPKLRKAEFYVIRRLTYNNLGESVITYYLTKNPKKINKRCDKFEMIVPYCDDTIKEVE
ncbi:MAG: hypothetical protein KAT68_17275 [Bacteroidales bacterium]|nr:hypothetical protein [Bacteroidales bacterium]